MSNYRVQPYSNYLTQIGALIGVPSGSGGTTSRISTELAASLNAFWNSNYNRVLETFEWVEWCPYGEARFVGNYLTYPNDLAQTAYWTATAVTVTANNLKNPLDGRTTASKMMETAATDSHSVTQTVTIVQNTVYNFSVYARPNGRNWIQLRVNDGVNTYTAFFNFSTGALGTVSGTGATSTMSQMAAGFYLCVLQFTTATTATATATAAIRLSTDGSTVSYAGDTTKGAYFWGALVQQATNIGVADSLVAYNQTGETQIDTVFQVWQDSPDSTSLPREVGYVLTPDGIQIIDGAVVSYAVVNSAGVTINSPQPNPVFLYYKKTYPNFQGDAYSATSTYSVGNYIYFNASDGTSDYWKCIVATSAGQDPDTTPASWEKQEIFDSLFWPVIWWCYSDWLASDGQSEKSTWAAQMAQNRFDNACERQSRQSRRDSLPLVVNTWITSRSGAYW